MDRNSLIHQALPGATCLGPPGSEGWSIIRLSPIRFYLNVQHFITNNQSNHKTPDRSPVMVIYGTLFVSTKNIWQRHIGLNFELISSVIVTTYIECLRILYDDHVNARGVSAWLYQCCWVHPKKYVYGSLITVVWYQPLLPTSSHYNDVIRGTMASQITSLTIVYSTVYSGADQRKHQSSASLAFVWGIHRWPVNSPHKWPVTRKMFPFDDVIMQD